MRKTEKKYWVNGYQTRGSGRKFLTFRIFNIGIMITNFMPVVEIYKLVNYEVKYNSIGDLIKSDNLKILE